VAAHAAVAPAPAATATAATAAAAAASPAAPALDPKTGKPLALGAVPLDVRLTSTVASVAERRKLAAERELARRERENRRRARADAEAAKSGGSAVVMSQETREHSAAVLRAWAAAGHVLFAGVNLPSKTFGELAEQVYHTPRISADQLAQWLAQDHGVTLVPLDEAMRAKQQTAIAAR
jgi:hypothetical protein